MEKKIEALSKPFWYITDIQNYLNCSKSYALEIKARVIKVYGVPDAFREKTQQAVRADDVIKYVGGNNRLEELAICNLAKEELPKNDKTI